LYLSLNNELYLSLNNEPNQTRGGKTGRVNIVPVPIGVAVKPMDSVSQAPFREVESKANM